MKKPLIYRITIQGRLRESWSEWFNGMTIVFGIEPDGSPVTTLTGPIVDQTALYGLLIKVRDLGLRLVSVERLETGDGSIREGK